MQSRKKTQAECEEYRYRYEPEIVDRIILPDDVSGLVGIRQWGLHQDFYITSVVFRRRYDSPVIWADKIPTAKNRNGIYACRVPVLPSGATNHWHDTVLGVVELTGQVVIHEDGVLRGECCRALMFIAHPDLAERLSRVYGIPAMASASWSCVFRSIHSWIYNNDGISVLKHNADLVSDMQAKKLLSQVDSLRTETEQGTLAERVCEYLKDKGEPLQEDSDYIWPCTPYFTLIVRNAALQQRLSGDWKAFLDEGGFIRNDTIAVLQAECPSEVNGPLSSMLGSGFTDQEDYVLTLPACPRSSRFRPHSDGKSGQISLRAGWLKSEIDWLNARIRGRYWWDDRSEESDNTDDKEGKMLPEPDG